MMKAIETSMDLTPRGFGGLELIKAVTQATVCPIWAHFTDRTDRRLLMAQACILWGIFTVLIGLSQGVLSFTLLCVINGSVLVSMKPISQSVAADISQPEERGRLF